MFGRKTSEDEECVLCDSVMAVAGALVGVVLIVIAFDLLTHGSLSGRVADRFDHPEDNDG